MDKRLEKRHKREVARANAKKKARVSEPDVRTHEEIEAAREASRADGARSSGSKVAGTGRSFRNNKATSTGSAARTDA